MRSDGGTWKNKQKDSHTSKSLSRAHTHAIHNVKPQWNKTIDGKIVCANHRMGNVRNGIDF